MRFKKTLLVLLLVFTLSFSAVTLTVYGGTGSIRISPTWPVMTESPAEFTVWVQPSDDVTDPHIFLVMTESCYLGLIGDVEVEWTGGSVTMSGWIKETSNGVKLPLLTTPGAGYTVASLKSHLGTEEAIYWAVASIFEGDIEVGETYDLKVSMASSDPEMLVYIVGKSSGSELFDMVIPPTNPGFVVPEVPLGTIAGLVTMLGSALMLKRRK